MVHTIAPTVKRVSELTDAEFTMSPERLISNSRYPLHVEPSKDALYQWLARLMADEIKANNARNALTRWILPVGPKGQYPILAQITNQERISWHNVHAFHMDEWLDWQGRPVSPDHPFSFRGFCDRNLYNLIDPALRPPEEQIVYPSVYKIDEFSERIHSVGGIDTTFAGFGYRGHLAFNEPPSTRWHKISADEMATSKTRIVPLLDDTLVALSHRMTGGSTQHIPRMAITVGMADILASRSIWLITDGGAWKQYILRVFVLSNERTADLPVTLCHGHANVRLAADSASVAPLPLKFD